VPHDESIASDRDGLGVQSIRFAGGDHSSTKHYWEGTQRVVAPEVTIERVRPHFAQLGLTRLADITGLDRLGIPTVLSVRPNSRSLSVDAGKGFTLKAAMASAVMECVERHHGETAESAEFRASYESVASKHAVVPFEQLMRVKAANFTRRTALNWMLGENLLTNREVAAPAMMVRLDKAGKGETLPPPFSSDSNGLAAGNNLLEAINHGLLECIERDAVTCWRLAWGSGYSPPRVRMETIAHDATRELLNRCSRAEVRAVLLDCTVDTGIPVYLAYLYDSMRHLGLYCGYGAHLDAGIAMVRAITEAAQGRLVYIAGARDDFFRHVDLRCRISDDVGTVRLLEDMPETVDVGGRRSLATATFEGDISFLLRRLERVGIVQVIAFDLTQPALGLPAVRIVIPGLEGYDSEFSVPGARARAFLRAAHKDEER
jgi:ribosomal protein S12 methylthiotransferase accessory factor